MKEKVGRMSFSRVGFWTLVQLWWGKLRRVVLGHMFKGYTRRRHALRRGECKRCGTCCQLGWVCGDLTHDEAGKASCVRYNSDRHPPCQLFPTTASDLMDVRKVREGAVCGFHFVEKGSDEG